MRGCGVERSGIIHNVFDRLTCSPVRSLLGSLCIAALLFRGLGLLFGLFGSFSLFFVNQCYKILQKLLHDLPGDQQGILHRNTNDPASENQGIPQGYSRNKDTLYTQSELHRGVQSCGL